MRLSLNGFVLFLFLVTHTIADNVDIPEDWIEPHAWGNVQKVSGSRENLNTVNPGVNPGIGVQCPKDEAHQFYRKLVNFLFDPLKLQESPDGKRMTRSVHLHVTKKLLERLKEAETARDIDSVVFEVIELSREGKIEQIKEIVMSFTEIIGFYLNEIHQSDTLLFLCLGVGTLLFVWFVSRRMQRNIVLVFILTIGAISYFLMYLDCNRRLEIKKLLELNEENEKNPCEVKSKSFFSWSKYSEDECYKHLMKSYGPQRSICPPTEVLLEFFGHLTVTQIITFVKQSHLSFKDIFTNYSFTDKLLIFPFILLILYIVVPPIIRYSFMYIMPAVLTNLNDHGDGPRNQNARNPDPQIQDSDRLVLAGESVQRLLTLLRQSAPVPSREAEGALAAEGEDRVQALNNENTSGLREGQENEESPKERLQNLQAITEKEEGEHETPSVSNSDEANPKNSLTT